MATEAGLSGGVSRANVAIVTGAGSGIGLETARLLSRAGWSVVLAGRREGALMEAGKSLEGPWKAMAGSVGDGAFVGELVGGAARVFGGVDAVVNCAGAAALASIPNHTPEMVTECFGVNSIGPANIMSAAWSELAKSAASRGRGTIVNVSSMASIDPFNGFFAYAASKSAVNMLTKVGDREGKRQKIRCFCVAPGAVETPMLRSMFTKSQVPEAGALAPADVARVIVDCIEGKRDAEAGEVILVRR